MKPLFTIVIPARREEEAIISTLDALKKKVKTPHEIIVVNDSNSSDKTSGVVKKYLSQKGNSHVKLVTRTNHPKPTFATALALGFENAKADFVLPVMADLCDAPGDIDRLYEKTQEGWDIVCGSRYVRGGGKKGGPFFQSACSWIICMSLHYLTRVPTHDVSNAFKLYRKKILRDIVIHEKSGVEVSMAITLQAYFHNAKITDIPTTWIGRTLGQSKFKIIERAPKYSHIYIWAVENTVRKLLRLGYKNYVGKNF